MIADPADFPRTTAPDRPYRLIPSRFPPVAAFEAIASAEDLEAIFELEGWTNAWRSAQEQLATLAPNARYIVAPESAHYIQLQQTELVIDAVRQVVEAVRDPNSWAEPSR